MGFSGGQSGISGASDVALSNPGNTHILSYNSTLAKWGNRTIAQVKSDLNVSNVDNTSDANKPVSTAQANALGTKADDLEVVHLTSNESVSGVKTFTNAPAIPDASFSIAKTSGLQTALNGKVTAVTANAKLWIGNQAAYDAIGTKDPTTLYAITS